MKCPEPYTPEEIVKISTTGGQPMQQMIATIMKNLLACKPFTKGVINFIRFRGGTASDGEDIMMEGLVQTATNLENKKYQATSGITGYAFGICKFKWFNLARKKGLDTVEMDDSIRQIKGSDSHEDWVINEESKNILWTYVAQQSGNCPQYLKYWAFGYKTEEIAREMEINIDSVRKKTSKCRKRLVDWLEQHPQKAALLKGIHLD